MQGEFLHTKVASRVVVAVYNTCSQLDSVSSWECCHIQPRGTAEAFIELINLSIVDIKIAVILRAV
ncbi:hypothetical protein SDC9_59097 [bioreactor metagenome]|uniref:Uncharacterized protein n=1 Tax=bioreactor metagenome TaxID=1076179 RepID=A0A644XF03_9ZZZZ